jgi:hypothetical protein
MASVATEVGHDDVGRVYDLVNVIRTAGDDIVGQLVFPLIHHLKDQIKAEELHQAIETVFMDFVKKSIAEKPNSIVIQDIVGGLLAASTNKNYTATCQQNTINRLRAERNQLKGEKDELKKANAKLEKAVKRLAKKLKTAASSGTDSGLDNSSRGSKSSKSDSGSDSEGSGNKKRIIRWDGKKLMGEVVEQYKPWSGRGAGRPRKFKTQSVE